MINTISKHIKQVLTRFKEKDSLLFNNQLYTINKANFKEINVKNEPKTMAFIDGGQAEILSAANFCLSFIRIAAVTFQNTKRVNFVKNEFYLFTTALYQETELYYQSKIFSFAEALIEENDLFISSNDSSIKNGMERAPITKVANIARRFAELKLATQIKSDFIILDGTLEKTFNQEEKYLTLLPFNVSVLAKTSSLFTTLGNSPVVLLNKIGPQGCWCYFVNDTTAFVKLHSQARHIFRFEGNKEILPLLLENSSDALFLGYPYGLIFADKVARVSDEEKQALRMKFLLCKENREIVDYLQATNAHSILDKFW